jgi:hypothetical protein
MKKMMLIAVLTSAALWMSAQNQINMIWCGNKEAGNSESIILTPECVNEAPRFWSPEKGDLKCLGFKMALVRGDEASVFTSYNGFFSEGMQAAFKAKTASNQIHFYDVIVQTSGGETLLSEKVYKVRYKLSK